jgi:ribA/ribD-fused uncharacterized protein
MADWLNNIKSSGDTQLELRAVKLFEEFKQIVIKAGVQNYDEYAENLFDRIMHLYKSTERVYTIGPHDGVIDSFFSKYRFLSNFEPCTVVYDGMTYSCSEAAYQAAKTTDVSLRIAFTTMNGSKAKYAGQKLTLRPDWNDIKVDVMYQIVKDKFFRNPELRVKLLNTGDLQLIEGNYWGDTFWGVCNGKGENHLGKILMRVRKELAEIHE